MCAPQGTQGQGRLFYHKFQPRQYPVLCISPQLGLFPSPRICAHDRARLSSVTCVHVPEHQVPGGFDARCHVRSRLQVEPWRAASQPVGGQSNHLDGHAMLLESAVSLLMAPS